MIEVPVPNASMFGVKALGDKELWAVACPLENRASCLLSKARPWTGLAMCLQA